MAVRSDMLGLVSSESYATAVRGTCYGLSAAVGKVSWDTWRGQEIEVLMESTSGWSSRWQPDLPSHPIQSRPEVHLRKLSYLPPLDARLT